MTPCPIPGRPPLQPRDWGHRVAYSLDPDGHVLAFADRIDAT